MNNKGVYYARLKSLRKRQEEIEREMQQIRDETLCGAEEEATNDEIEAKAKALLEEIKKQRDFLRSGKAVQESTLIDPLSYLNFENESKGKKKPETITFSLPCQTIIHDKVKEMGNETQSNRLESNMISPNTSEKTNSTSLTENLSVFSSDGEDDNLSELEYSISTKGDGFFSSDESSILSFDLRRKAFLEGSVDASRNLIRKTLIPKSCSFETHANSSLPSQKMPTRSSSARELYREDPGILSTILPPNHPSNQIVEYKSKGNESIESVVPTRKCAKHRTSASERRLKLQKIFDAIPEPTRDSNYPPSHMIEFDTKNNNSFGSLSPESARFSTPKERQIKLHKIIDAISELKDLDITSIKASKAPPIADIGFDDKGKVPLKIDSTSRTSESSQSGPIQPVGKLQSKPVDDKSHLNAIAADSPAGVVAIDCTCEKESSSSVLGSKNKTSEPCKPVGKSQPGSENKRSGRADIHTTLHPKGGKSVLSSQPNHNHKQSVRKPQPCVENTLYQRIKPADKLRPLSSKLKRTKTDKLLRKPECNDFASRRADINKTPRMIASIAKTGSVDPSALVSNSKGMLTPFKRGKAKLQLSALSLAPPKELSSHSSGKTQYRSGVHRKMEGTRTMAAMPQLQLAASIKPTRVAQARSSASFQKTTKLGGPRVATLPVRQVRKTPMSGPANLFKQSKSTSKAMTRSVQASGQLGAPKMNKGGRPKGNIHPSPVQAKNPKPPTEYCPWNEDVDEWIDKAKDWLKSSFQKQACNQAKSFDSAKEQIEKRKANESSVKQELEEELNENDDFRKRTGGFYLPKDKSEDPVWTFAEFDEPGWSFSEFEWNEDKSILSSRNKQRKRESIYWRTESFDDSSTAPFRRR